MGFLDGAMKSVSKVTRMLFDGRSMSQYQGGIKYAEHQFYPEGWMPGSNSDYVRETGLPWLNSSTSAVLRWIMDEFPRAKLTKYKETEDGQLSPIYDKSVYEIIKYPNPYYSYNQFCKDLIFNYIVEGNAYVLKVRNRLDEVIELWTLPAWLVDPMHDESGVEFVSHYDYTVNGVRYQYDPRDIIHFRDGVDPLNVRKGLGRIRPVLRQIATLNEVETYIRALIKNHGLPGVIISSGDSEAPFGPSGTRRLRRQIDTGFSGDNRFRVMVSDKPLKVDTIGFTPEEMNLKAIPDRAEALICANIGISSMVVHLPSSSEHNTYGNADDARAGAWSRIASMQDDIASTLSSDPDLNPDKKSNSWGWDRSMIAALRYDQMKLAEIATKMLGTPSAPGYITINHAREIVGEDKIPGLDIYMKDLIPKPEDHKIVKNKKKLSSKPEDSPRVKYGTNNKRVAREQKNTGK